MDYLSLCLICKDENDYLPEWLDYHILAGVDHFYIYDNESSISLRETLADYIERGWVVVIDIRGKARQIYAYDHCLQTFGHLTFWLGFIDTDEFLVPKSNLNLKELLKNYEDFGGLAVSSLFFGSNGYKTRPPTGQIAAYTKRTHETFKENELLKCIVQPGWVVLPNSPHDFTFKDGAWCVNENFRRVDGQRFPNCTDKIQLNHYYCRSETEINMKLRRGRGDSGEPWLRNRFDKVNQLATYEDTSIHQNLAAILQPSLTSKTQQFFSTTIQAPNTLCERMAAQIHNQRQTSLEITYPLEVHSFRAELLNMDALKEQAKLAIDRGDFAEARRLLLLQLQIVPQCVNLYLDLSIFCLDLGDPAAAWQALSQAWQLSPNSHIVLSAMAYYFLKVNNFSMAENTCRLVIEQAPHDMTNLGLLTYSLIGQERFEEALKVGVPVIEMDWRFYELPDGMVVFLVKRLADYLQKKQDYAGAASLWQAGVECQTDDVTALLELAQALHRVGDKTGARKRLTQAQALAETEGQASKKMTALIQIRNLNATLFPASKKKH